MREHRQRGRHPYLPATKLLRFSPPFIQANVYHALTPEHRHLALKIYKTSILVFKDRDRYVSGEFRFRRGYRCGPQRVDVFPIMKLKPGLLQPP